MVPQSTNWSTILSTAIFIPLEILYSLSSDCWAWRLGFGLDVKPNNQNPIKTDKFSNSLRYGTDTSGAWFLIFWTSNSCAPRRQWRINCDPWLPSWLPRSTCWHQMLFFVVPSVTVTVTSPPLPLRMVGPSGYETWPSTTLMRGAQ